MLHQKFSPDDIRTLLVPRASFTPYPPAGDRDAWEALPADTRRALVEAGERFLGYAYPSLPATLFLEFAREGNRSRYETQQFTRRAALEALVVAECAEAGERFLDDIANGVWAVCEESFWGIPAHVGEQRAGVTLPDVTEPVVDLFAAETGNLLAWTAYLLGDRLDSVSPLVRERVRLEINRRILEPMRERDDFRWMGFAELPNDRKVNNWNPWICSNWLAATLLNGSDEEQRARDVHRIVRTVDNFIDTYPADGGCDEGPSYWGHAGASLFDTLDLLYRASDGAISVFDEPLVEEIGRYIYRAHIADDYYVNFADAPAIVRPRASLVRAYGERIGDDDMVAFGRWLEARGDAVSSSMSQRDRLRPANLQRVLRRLFAQRDKEAGARDASRPGAGSREAPAASADAAPGRPPLPGDVWLPDIQVMVARDREGTTDGFLLAAKGGHNAESHNHNDVGSFVVYRDGRPLIVDAGVETYSRKTFSDRRYEIWTMQSAFHTLLPALDGVQQEAGARFAASDVHWSADDSGAELELDIASAYPPQAGLDRWRRSVRLDRATGVRIHDEYRLSRPIGRLTISVLTPCAARIDPPGTVVLAEREIVDGRSSASGVLTFDHRAFSATLERIDIHDDRLAASWGNELTLVVFTAQSPQPNGAFEFRFDPA